MSTVLRIYGAVQTVVLAVQTVNCPSPHALRPLAICRMDALLASRGLAHPGYPMLGLYMCGRCRRHRSGGRHQPRPIAKAVLVLYSS
jgi:hypothetical protein